MPLGGLMVRSIACAGGTACAALACEASRTMRPGSQDKPATWISQSFSARFARTDGWGYPDLVWEYGYRGEQQHFVERVAGAADEVRAATPAQARDALALVLAAQRSLDQGGPVRPE